MTATKTAEMSPMFREARPVQYIRIPGIPSGGDDALSPAFADTPGSRISDQVARWFSMAGIDLSPEEYNELEIFGEFLERHVKPVGIRDVQCMLLWSEWVRMYRRNATGFPMIIREKEFRSAITGRFGAGIFTDEWRGPVFTGLCFVP
jgi:hypothetical protein